LPSLIIGRSPPSAGFVDAVRLKKMLKNAAKRCQATPIVMLSAIVMSQAMLTTIFTAAMIETMFIAVCSGRPLNAAPMACETGAAHTGYGRFPAAALKPRIPKPRIRTARIVYST